MIAHGKSIIKTQTTILTLGWGWPWLAPAAFGLLAWISSAAGAEAPLETVRVLTTEPACFEYLYTGVANSAAGRPVLSFNHRSGRTFFVEPGERLGPYRVMAFEMKTNRVFSPSLNACLDKPTGSATLAGPGDAAIILEQDQPLPQPGRVAWLVRLDNGMWWNVQEEDVFLTSNQLVFVEEIDEDGVVVTAGEELVFIPRITSAEKKGLNRLWAEQKRRKQREQEEALQYQQEAARAKASAAVAGTAWVVQESGPHVEIRGPTRFFYGTEYRFPTSFKVCPGAYSLNGRYIQAPCVIPASFETRYSGILLTAP